MVDVNVQFVQATKEILKKMGFEIKTTQVYELYSKLAKEKNWNIAKNKNIDFTNEIIIKNLPLVDLVQNIKNLNSTKIITRLLEESGHELKELNNLIDPYGLSHIVDWKSANKSVIKIAVMTRTVEDDNFLNHKIITPKVIQRLARGISNNQCTRGIIFTSDKWIPQNIYKLAVENSIEIVHYEDLLRLAYQIDATQSKISSEKYYQLKSESKGFNLIKVEIINLSKINIFHQQITSDPKIQVWVKTDEITKLELEDLLKNAKEISSTDTLIKRTITKEQLPESVKLFKEKINEKIIFEE